MASNVKTMIDKAFAEVLAEAVAVLREIEEFSFVLGASVTVRAVSTPAPRNPKGGTEAFGCAPDRKKAPHHPTGPYLSAEEVADVLQFSVRTITTWAWRLGRPWGVNLNFPPAPAAVPKSPTAPPDGRDARTWGMSTDFQCAPHCA